MTQVGNWVSETCSTEGAGPLYLTGARTDRVRFAQAMTEGDVWYVVEDVLENACEVGMGHFDGRDLITRDVVYSTRTDGAYERFPSTPLNLSGNSYVSSIFTAEAYEGLLNSIGEISRTFTATVEEVIATAGQVNFTVPTYNIGTNDLAVFINGIRQYPSAYIETSSTSIAFSEGLQENDYVMFEVRK